MDKTEAKRFGAWVSLIGGTVFLVGAAAAVYIAFFIDPKDSTRIIIWLSRLFHHS